MKEFNKPIPKELIDIVEKTRSNMFSWRGQFSPQLIEIILKYYCLPNSIILDPFVGSGTVLLEAGSIGYEAYGFEINPAALIMSRIFEFINNNQRSQNIQKIREKINSKSIKRFSDAANIKDFKEIILDFKSELNRDSCKILEALVILLNLDKNELNYELIQNKFCNLVDVINSLPSSNKKIKVGLSDARCLPLKNSKVDFVLTSPPYINVFNYHQNYRKSAELLGWNLLQIAKSEIGSNRANRSNRFYTVVQYCLDMADSLKEIARVTKTGGRIVLVIGHQSNVLGVPFYNADIIEEIGVKSGLFTKIIRQKREFKNKFGKIIREDIINFINCCNCIQDEQKELNCIAREVALNALQNNLSKVSQKNAENLRTAINRVQCIEKTKILARDYSVYVSSRST